MNSIALTAAQRDGLDAYLNDPQKCDHWPGLSSPPHLRCQVEGGTDTGCNVVIRDEDREFLLEESDRAAHHVRSSSLPGGNALYRELMAKSVPRARGFLAACDAILARPELEVAA